MGREILQLYHDSMAEAAFWRRIWKQEHSLPLSMVRDFMLAAYRHALAYKADALKYGV